MGSDETLGCWSFVPQGREVLVDLSPPFLFVLNEPFETLFSLPVNELTETLFF